MRLGRGHVAGGAGTELFLFLGFYGSSARGVLGLPVWVVVTTKGTITVDIPRHDTRHSQPTRTSGILPEMERDRVGWVGFGRSGEEAQVSWWGCQGTVSSLMDGHLQLD